MQNLQKTRFVAANYSNLQGLRAVPLGLLLLLVVGWANTQAGRSGDLSLPILFAAGMSVLTWGINHYYQNQFGRIEKTPRQKRLELALGVMGGALALGAFIIDTAFDLPFSLVGLVFAAAILADYLRMQWYAPGHYLLPGTLVTFTIMLVVSLLPLLAGEWWRTVGLRTQLFGVLAAAGAIIIGTGLFGHWFFTRQLPGRQLPGQEH